MPEKQILFQLCNCCNFLIKKTMKKKEKNWEFLVSSFKIL